ncbi:putative GNAT family N-acyltransferase [Stenotrophomonas maltophilia]|nr:putative GNAT family N-acyltransferase [Stenotrophomonas maltophilia]
MMTEETNMPTPTPTPTPTPISIRVARTLHDLTDVIAVRSIVYVEEQHCPLHEEFDGNDVAGSTHLLATLDEEAAGVLRIRWFADFAKVERVAVRRRYRGGMVSKALLQSAFSLAEDKGYRRMLLHIEPSLVEYYLRHGFQPRAGRPRFHYSDREYMEVIKELMPASDAISMDSPALCVVRPEGAWREAGVLDLSSARGIAQRGGVCDEVCKDAQGRSGIGEEARE